MFSIVVLQRSTPSLPLGNFKPFRFYSVFSPDKKHHFESLNNNEMVDSEVLVTRKKLDHLGEENVKDK